MPEIDEERVALFAVLGEFITSFAFTEAGLHVFFRKLTGMKEDAARIVCAGMRNSDLIRKIKDLSEISDLAEETKARVRRILKQLLIVSEIRDHVVHRWSVFYPGSSVALSTDFLTAKTQVAPVNFIRYDKETITNAQMDLWMMQVELMAISTPRLHQNPDKKSYLTYSWRYKPAPQGTLGHIAPEVLQ